MVQVFAHINVWICIKVLWQPTIKTNPSITNNPIYFQLTFLSSEKVCVEFHRIGLSQYHFRFSHKNQNEREFNICANWCSMGGNLTTHSLSTN